MDAVRMVHESALLCNVGLETETSCIGSAELGHGRSTLTSLSSSYSDASYTRSRYMPLILLHVYGIVPLTAAPWWRLYGCCVPLMVLGVCSYYLCSLTFDLAFLYLRLSGACYMLGCVFGYFFLQREGICHLLGPWGTPLERYAAAHGFLEEWLHNSRRMFLITCLSWACVVAVIISIILSDDDSESVWFASAESKALTCLSVALGSGFLVALTYCQLHVFCCLELMVDKFCIGFFEDPDLNDAIQNWNVMQAILRRAANTVDTCVLATQTSVFATLALTSTELFVGEGAPAGKYALLWALLCLLGVVLAFLSLFRAAIVSEKCSRVPALLNTLRLEGSPINFERQYVVQYIEHSAAGFYIKGVRLTPFMVLKMAYLVGAVVFAGLTRLHNQSSR
eukprot:TRINITY_DN39257_c0_g1_i1.p1 TRINITY_DN39257_c0_g1~~TRINITY_DN39257_c0_g1_i1.p1  ORF type:complete len:462 (+),score=33.52 TRINITY_DN39257_c0_g1_i1:203-1387(+)